jgi:predicted ester cyclase
VAAVVRSNSTSSIITVPQGEDMTTTTLDQKAAVAEAAIHAVLAGTPDELAKLVHPEATNQEALAEPPDTRGQGPQAFHATGEWLRTAFSDLAWTTEQSTTEGDLVVTFGSMSGRHTGDFVVWTEDGHVERVFVPTGKSFTVRHAHFQRIRDGLVVEHWAVRDDQGMAMQAGWIPPSLGFLIRCALATKRARRATR